MIDLIKVLFKVCKVKLEMYNMRRKARLYRLLSKTGIGQVYVYRKLSKGKK